MALIKITCAVFLAANRDACVATKATQERNYLLQVLKVLKSFKQPGEVTLHVWLL